MRTVVMSLAVLLSTVFLHTPAVAGPIHDAARNGKAEQVEGLIAAGTAVDEKDGLDKTALHWAADEGHTEVSRMLVAKGADVNAKDFRDETPLSYAVWEKNEDIVKLLIGKGADVNQKNADGDSVLDDAVRRGLKGIAEKLRRAGAKCGTGPLFPGLHQGVRPKLIDAAADIGGRSLRSNTGVRHEKRPGKR